MYKYKFYTYYGVKWQEGIHPSEVRKHLKQLLNISRYTLDNYESMPFDSHLFLSPAEIKALSEYFGIKEHQFITTNPSVKKGQMVLSMV